MRELREKRQQRLLAVVRLARVPEHVLERSGIDPGAARGLSQILPESMRRLFTGIGNRCCLAAARTLGLRRASV